MIPQRMSGRRSRGTSVSPHRGAFPKGVWFQPKRLADGSVVRYGYLGRGRGSIALGRQGSAEFHEALAVAMRSEPSKGTLFNLIWRYRQSPEFGKLRPRTQADYLHQLDKAAAQFGPLSLRAMGAREITPHIFAWRDSLADHPRRADYAVQTLKALLSWGVRRGLLDHNRAAGVGMLYRSGRSDKIWSPPQITAFIAAAPEPIQRAMVLALETGQRQGDLLRLPWSAVDGDKIRLRQNKTGARVTVPVSSLLREALNRAPAPEAMTILTRADGESWDAKGNGFRQAWSHTRKRAAVEGVTFHDLRGTFVTRRLAAGWSTQEVAMCTGHSLRDLASLDAYADRQTIADASADRLILRALGHKP